MDYTSTLSSNDAMSPSLPGLPKPIVIQPIVEDVISSDCDAVVTGNNGNELTTPCVAGNKLSAVSNGFKQDAITLIQSEQHKSFNASLLSGHKIENRETTVSGFSQPDVITAAPSKKSKTFSGSLLSGKIANWLSTIDNNCSKLDVIVPIPSKQRKTFNVTLLSSKTGSKSSTVNDCSKPEVIVPTPPTKRTVVTVRLVSGKLTYEAPSGSALSKRAINDRLFPNVCQTPHIIQTQRSISTRADSSSCVDNQSASINSLDNQSALVKDEDEKDVSIWNSLGVENVWSAGADDRLVAIKDEDAKDVSTCDTDANFAAARLNSLLYKLNANIDKYSSTVFVDGVTPVGSDSDSQLISQGQCNRDALSRMSQDTSDCATVGTGTSSRPDIIVPVPLKPQTIKTVTVSLVAGKLRHETPSTLSGRNVYNHVLSRNSKRPHMMPIAMNGSADSSNCVSAESAAVENATNAGTIASMSPPDMQQLDRTLPHNSSPGVISTSPSGVKRKHECPWCLKAFKCAQHLTAHKRIHTGDRPFACDVCDATFRHAGNLYNHKLTHLTHRKWKCWTCSKTFRRSDQLTVHRRIHEKVYECQLCSVTFPTLQLRRLHKERVHNMYVMHCRRCYKTFPRKHLLVNHVCAGTAQRTSDDDDDVDDDDVDGDDSEADIVTSHVTHIAERKLARGTRWQSSDDSDSDDGAHAHADAEPYRRSLRQQQRK